MINNFPFLSKNQEKDELKQPLKELQSRFSALENAVKWISSRLENKALVKENVYWRIMLFKLRLFINYWIFTSYSNIKFMKKDVIYVTNIGAVVRFFMKFNNLRSDSKMLNWH